MNTIAIDDLKANPELLLSLFEEKDQTWIVSRKGGSVTVSPYRAYSDEVNQILAEAKAEYAVKERSGYTREEAFDDLDSVLQEIERQRQ